MILYNETAAPGQFQSRLVLKTFLAVEPNGSHHFGECNAPFPPSFRCAGQLQAIQIKKPHTWLKLRDNYNSDKATDRAYERTEDGINEIGLDWEIKRIGKLIQAINSLLQVAEGQAKNLY